jgi:sporulation protein YlmC with PRC-barrel domain
MKNPLKNHLLILIMMLPVFGNVTGQDRIRQVSCFDSTLKRQADSLKLNLAQQGFIVVKEATMTMESEYEMPVIVPLNQGTWYQFAFIGDMSSKLYEVRMYDYDEKQVVYQKHYGDGMESNIINYSYIPKVTEYHIIKPVQVSKKKKKNLCGYIIMFKKVK